MLRKLLSLPTAHRLIPFVLMAYGSDSTFIWTDNEGIQHEIQQGEGGEQGDALMPALFCLGLHEALHNVHSNLRSGEQLVAYLDDIYVLTKPDRARQVYDELTGEIRRITGIEPNLGKTECWSHQGGAAPVGIEALNAPSPAPPVWKGNLDPEFNRIEVLGSPIGRQQFCERYLIDKLQEERKLLSNLVYMSNIQVAWLLLYFCGSPRSN